MIRKYVIELDAGYSNPSEEEVFTALVDLIQGDKVLYRNKLKHISVKKVRQYTKRSR